MTFIFNVLRKCCLSDLNRKNKFITFKPPHKLLVTRSVKIIIYNKGQAVFGLCSIHTFITVFVIYSAFHYITNSYIFPLITMHTFQFLWKKCCELLYCLSCHTLEKSIEIIEMQLRIILRIVIFVLFFILLSQSSHGNGKNYL